MNTNPIFDQIKSAISCFDYARSYLRLDVQRPGDRCAATFRGGDNPSSLIINTDYWFDFGTGNGGDVIDLCACVNHNGDKAAAIREMAENLGLDYKCPCNGGWDEYKRRLESMTEQVSKWHKQLRPEDQEYMHKRGITDETIDRLKFGFDGKRLVIPYWKNGKVVYYITRDRGLEGAGAAKYKKAQRSDYNDHIPWGLQSLNPSDAMHTKLTRQENLLIIAEGVFDALSCEQEGYCVLSPITGKFSTRNGTDKLVFDICKRFRDGVFVIFDTDKAGKGFTRDFIRELFARGIKFSCGSTPGKDVSEYYEERKKIDPNADPIDELLTKATAGALALAATFTSTDDLKQYIEEKGRYIESVNLMELRVAITLGEKFHKKHIEAIFKKATTCPPEQKIAEEVIRGRNLRFNSRTGFVDYDQTAGKWIYIDNERVMRWIGHALGPKWNAGKKQNSILTVVKSLSEADISDVTFNRGAILNFKNGVLEYDNDNATLQKHSPQFMSSAQLSYPYIPDAQCPNFLKFIEEVTGGNDARAKLLIQAMAYPLCTDNSLHKAFVFLGDGANGKSTCLELLRMIYGGDVNTNLVSCLDMKAMTEQFQRIFLKDAILNIATEARIDVRGAEKAFKGIVAGDLIDGCFKGKDHIQFVSRAKIFIACNEMLRSNDTTYGFNRRLSYIPFDVTFSQQPRGDDKSEKKVDKKKLTALKPELPGIFNLLLSTYRTQLRDGSGFSEGLDQVRINREAAELNNQIVAFALARIDLFDGCPVGRQVMYSAYAAWAKETAHGQLSSNEFGRKLEQTVRQYKNDGWTRYKNQEAWIGHNRTYCIKIDDNWINE